MVLLRFTSNGTYLAASCLLHPWVPDKRLRSNYRSNTYVAGLGKSPPRLCLLFCSIFHFPFSLSFSLRNNLKFHCQTTFNIDSYRFFSNSICLRFRDDNQTSEADKNKLFSFLGLEQVRSLLDKGTSSARNGYDLGSKTARFGLKVGTQTLTSKFGTKNRDSITSDGWVQFLLTVETT